MQKKHLPMPSVHRQTNDLKGIFLNKNPAVLGVASCSALGWSLRKSFFSFLSQKNEISWSSGTRTGNGMCHPEDVHFISGIWGDWHPWRCSFLIWCHPTVWQCPIFLGWNSKNDWTRFPSFTRLHEILQPEEPSPKVGLQPVPLWKTHGFPRKITHKWRAAVNNPEPHLES